MNPWLFKVAGKSASAWATPIVLTLLSFKLTWAADAGPPTQVVAPAPTNHTQPLPAAKGKPTVDDADRQFWSFRPLQSPPPPAVQNAGWSKSPIDRFILAALESKGLTPRAPAGRRQLIRRVSFDLIGLPPTPAELDEFVNDPAPDAYEKLIERLLASPHFGERWARHWLDVARFAESHGFEHDTDRPTAFHYRDFVIQALNQDLPYDRFVKWQIAGDELEPENPHALMATGYLAAGVHATQITANQAEKERYDELDDMAATIGTSMLGLTIGCARCHDHKFDPIPQSDYYRLLSTFTTTVRSEAELDFHPERFRAAQAAFVLEHAPLVAALDRFETEELPKRLDSWLASGVKPAPSQWLVLEAASLKSQGGAAFTNLNDGTYLATGKNPKSDTNIFIAHTTLKNITAVRLEALAHASFVKKGPGRAANGNFALSDFRLTAAPLDGPDEPVEVKLSNPKATFEQKGLPIAAAIDSDPKSGWAIDPQFGKDHAAVFELESPIGFEGGTKLTFTLKFEINDGHNIGRPRLSVTTSPNPATLDGDHGLQKFFLEVSAAWETPAAQRTEPQKKALAQWHRHLDLEWRKLNQAVQEHLQKRPKPELTKVLISSEGLPPVRLNTQGPDFYDKTYFLKRGDLSQKQGEATQSFLQVLMRTPDREKRWQTEPPQGGRTSYRRTALANWITDVDYGAGHLLARVAVNRLWQHHFGRGLVATPNDLGRQGQPPTHPELLDWLAQRLIAQGWSLKAMHKEILTSAAYRQSSEYDSACARIDPENLWRWRQSPRRLEGEAIRDAMLAVSGVLDERMFGPGSLKEDQRRRSIYFTMKRSKLISMMALFDAPDGLQSQGQRLTTTVAPQALLLLNNANVREWAESFARRLVPKANESLAAAIEDGYRIAVGRAPAQGELDDALGFLKGQIAAYQTGGRSKAMELALADFCQTLMGLNEFVYLE